MNQPSAGCDCSTQQNLNSLDSVVSYLLEQVKPVSETESVSLHTALNRVLAEDLSSGVSVPPADNSAVDGYALSADSLRATRCLTISQRIPAGLSPEPLQKGTAARIFTGASIPDGADCVVMQEHVELAPDGSRVEFPHDVSLHQNIRPMGQDIEAGQTILHQGQVLSPQRLGLSASTGCAQVQVYRPLRVAYFSTGDELVEPGEPIQSGQIYNSNRYLLRGLLRSLGFESIDLGVIPDDFEATKSALKEASKQADAVISTGGASVGEEDYIQAAIKALGQVGLWRVAIKPGKPFMFGQIGETPIIGLPGNPGAVFVTFLALARPFLLKAQGLTQVMPQTVKLPLAFDIKKAGTRREFLRVRQDESGRLVRHPNQSSGMLSSASWAEGLAIIPEHEVPSINSMVDFLSFSSLLSLND